MTVKEFKNELNNYKDDAEVVLVNWANGQTYEPSIGGDDDDEGYRDNDIEGQTYCRIGF